MVSTSTELGSGGNLRTNVKKNAYFTWGIYSSVTRMVPEGEFFVTLDPEESIVSCPYCLVLTLAKYWEKLYLSFVHDYVDPTATVDCSS